MTIDPGEAAEMLERLMAKDVEVENLARLLVGAKAAYDDLKAQLKDAQEARNQLSWEIRNPPPLFDRTPGPETTTYDDDVADGVRAAEVRREGEWDLDGSPISPEAMPKLTGPARPGKRRKAAAQA